MGLVGGPWGPLGPSGAPFPSLWPPFCDVDCGLLVRSAFVHFVFRGPGALLGRLRGTFGALWALGGAPPRPLGPPQISPRGSVRAPCFSGCPYRAFLRRPLAPSRPCRPPCGPPLVLRGVLEQLPLICAMYCGSGTLESSDRFNARFFLRKVLVQMFGWHASEHESTYLPPSSFSI